MTFRTRVRFPPPPPPARSRPGAPVAPGPSLFAPPRAAPGSTRGAPGEPGRAFRRTRRGVPSAFRALEIRLNRTPSGTTLPRPVNDTLGLLASNLASVRERIAAAERRSGRETGSVTLIGAVKTLPAETLAAAVALGLRDLGENRVQEAESHQRSVPRAAARWHMIGHLQRNKAGRALELFDVFHCIDDLDLAHALAQRAARSDRRMRTL